MQKKKRPVYLVGKRLAAIAQLGDQLEGWAETVTPGQVAAVGRQITELARAVNHLLWSWDDPNGELLGETDCQEMLYSIERLEEGPKVFTLKKF